MTGALAVLDARLTQLYGQFTERLREQDRRRPLEIGWSGFRCGTTRP